LRNLHKVALEIISLLIRIHSISLIANDSPILWSNSIQVQGCSQIWLIKDGHDHATMVHLELGEEILLVVSVVDKAMETDTIVSVSIKEVQSDRVSLASFQQRII